MSSNRREWRTFGEDIKSTARSFEKRSWVDVAVRMVVVVVVVDMGATRAAKRNGTTTRRVGTTVASAFSPGFSAWVGECSVVVVVDVVGVGGVDAVCMGARLA